MAVKGTDVAHVHKGSATVRQLSLGLIVGGAVTSLPWLVSKMNLEALWPINVISIPGTVVALALSGSAHDYSLTIVFAVNVVFYASLPDSASICRMIRYAH